MNNITHVRLDVVLEFDNPVSEEVATRTVKRVCEHLKYDYEAVGFTPDDVEECVIGFRVKSQLCYPGMASKGYNCKYGMICGRFGEKEETESRMEDDPRNVMMDCVPPEEMDL